MVPYLSLSLVANLCPTFSGGWPSNTNIISVSFFHFSIVSFKFFITFIINLFFSSIDSAGFINYAISFVPIYPSDKFEYLPCSNLSIFSPDFSLDIPPFCQMIGLASESVPNN